MSFNWPLCFGLEVTTSFVVYAMPRRQLTIIELLGNYDNDNVITGKEVIGEYRSMLEVF